MKNKIYKIIRKIIGIVFMMAGILGALIPIPLVPFFLLFFIGLGIYGVDKAKIEQLKRRLLRN